MFVEVNPNYKQAVNVVTADASQIPVLESEPTGDYVVTDEQEIDELKPSSDQIKKKNFSWRSKQFFF